MARVVLVNVPFQDDVASVAQTSVGPPMGLAYLAAVLRQAGHEALILDANVLGMDFDAVGKELVRIGPDVVGTTAATPSIHLAGELAKRVKRVCRGDVPVVVGGPHVSALPEETLRAYPEIDVVVVGEAEATVDRLVRALLGGSLEEIPNLAWRRDGAAVAPAASGAKGRAPRTGARDSLHEGAVACSPRDAVQVEKLDTLPFPARDLLPNPLYRTIDSWPMTCMIAVRGCPARCVYCAVPEFAGRRVRRRSPANVVAEMEECLSRWKIPFFSFIDDTFSTSRDWTLALADAMVASGIHRHASWSCLTRPDMVDEELLARMKKAGCVRVELGIESGSPAVLKFLRKGAKIEQIREAFRVAKKVGLATLGFAMVNVPGETPEDLDMTEKEILSIDPLFLQLSFCTPYPGTELHRYCVEHDLIGTTDWSAYRFLKEPVIRNPHLSPVEIARRHRRILSRFYMRPGKAAALARYALSHPKAATSLARTSWNALVAMWGR